MKILASLLFLLFSFTVQAQSPWYFGTGEAVNLTNGTKFSNGVKHISGSLNPSSSAVNAPAGSVYFSTNGNMYIKQDAGSTTNWILFGYGDIESINGQLGPSLSLASGSTGTDFNIDSTANVITFNLPSASATNRGLLPSADWSTFNNKEPSVTATTSADYYRGDKTFQPLDKAAVGLANVDNTSDATKDAATATLTNKTLTAPVINSPTGIVKADVGLGNVDNTSDLAKPISTATQTAIDNKLFSAGAVVDDSLVRFNGATGDYVQDSLVTVNDAGEVNTPGLTLAGNYISANGAPLILQSSTGDGVQVIDSMYMGNTTTFDNVYDHPADGANWELTVPTTKVRTLTTATLESLGSMVAPPFGAMEHTITNNTGRIVILKNEYASATAANRFTTGTGGDIAIPIDGTIRVVYIPSPGRWRVEGYAGLTLDIDQARIAGEAYISAAANCSWSNNTSAYTDFTADADCPTATSVSGLVGVAQLPQVSYTNLPPGVYELTAEVAKFEADASGEQGCIRLTDGTNTGTPKCHADNNVDTINSDLRLMFTTTSISTRTFKIQGYDAVVINNDTARATSIRFVLRYFGSMSTYSVSENNRAAISEVIFTSQTVDPPNFISAMNKSIGATGSGATYTGTDYFDLYDVLWAQAGTVTTAGHVYKISSAKGASSAADFAANKTITIDYETNAPFIRGKAAAASLGAYEDDALQNHRHNIFGQTTVNTGDGTSLNSGQGIISRGTGGYGTVFGSTTYLTDPVTSPTGGSAAVKMSLVETKPKNVSLNAYIRYRARSIITASLETPDSEIYVTGGSGFGSTNTKIRRFTTTAKATGTAITNSGDSATLGHSFTINTDGVFAITTCDFDGATLRWLGVSVNSNQLTTGITGITSTHMLILSAISIDRPSCISATTKLNAGDVVRAHTEGGTNGTSALYVTFRITQVSF